jgi:hypothetical protein
VRGEEVIPAADQTPVVIKVVDSVPGLLGTVTDWFLMLGAVFALGAVFVAAIAHAAAGPNLKVQAVRYDQNVYVRIVNKGRMAAEVRRVFLGVLPSAGSPDLIWHLDPEAESEDFISRLLQGKSSELVVLTLPDTLERSEWDDATQGRVTVPVAPDDVFAFIATHEGFKFARLVPEDSFPHKIKWDDDARRSGTMILGKRPEDP